MKALLSIDNVKKSFGKDVVLRSVSLSVREGAAVCIAGANASGKTTLLRIACGLLSPDGGSVTSNGETAFVPQQPTFLPGLSVQDNLRLWYSARNMSGPAWSDGSVETRLGLRPHRKKKAGVLSGGMKKRLSIALALTSVPRFLLLDEPFAALDAAACLDIEQLLLELKAQGVGILFTAHEPQRIRAVADELFVLSGGTLRPEGAPGDDLEHRLLTALFGG